MRSNEPDTQLSQDKFGGGILLVINYRNRKETNYYCCNQTSAEVFLSVGVLPVTEQLQVDYNNPLDESNASSYLHVTQEYQNRLQSDL